MFSECIDTMGEKKRKYVLELNINMYKLNMLVKYVCDNLKAI